MNIVTNKLKKTTITTIIFLMISLVFLSTIAYSAFSSTMHITGNAKARIEANVRITDFRIKNVTNATSSYEEFGKSHISTNVDLKTSSSTITYYLEITNYGTTDIGIFDITGLPTGVNYSIKDYNLHDKICNEEGKCNSFIKKTYELTLTTTSSYSGNIQLNFDFRTYHKITYTDITNNNYPTEVIDGGTLKITFKEELKRVQVLYNNSEILYYKTITNGQTITLGNIKKDVEVKIKDQAARLKNGSIDKVGSEVCIGNECFYIISNDGSKVKMLAKYNLHVGNKYDDTNGAIPLENPTGKQDPKAKGYFSGFSIEDPIIGTNNFSSTNYWSGTVSSYPSNVYNENSSIYEYVINYKNYLESYGTEVNDARLITIEELESIGCSKASYSCASAPSWVYSTTYWTSEAYSTASIWFVYSKKNLSYTGYKNNHIGVRPVIEIDIDEIFIPVAKLVKGNVGEIGSEVCIDNECFYTISSDNATVTMLTKYNLHVGNIYDGTTPMPIENPTGIQEKTAIGWFSGYNANNPLIATKIFSSTNYWSSNTSNYPAYVYNENSYYYEYVENYKRYLENLGIPIKDARLITKEELENLGCSSSTNSCTEAPSWVYATSYWSGIASSSTELWRVNTSGHFGTSNYTSENRGARPVITIPKKAIRDTINITIDKTIYKAEEGMTWEEWLESKYNTLGLVDSGQSQIKYSKNSNKFLRENQRFIYIDEIIDHSLNYSLDVITDGSND